ncbi:MAG: cupin domain-containing protein [Marivirga sp.]|nr:cupin domain-containing protein [Marivirga sp.]
MKISIITLVLVCVTALSSCAQQRDKKPSDTSHTFPKGNKINSANFKGTAYLQPLVEADSLNPTSVGNVSFEAGAHTKWHKHPGGQILLVMYGVGYYQEEGQAKRILRKGDVIKCPADVPHWHGASAETTFSHVAITNRHLGETVWLNAVTDKEYKE